MKKHGGNIIAYYQVKEVSLKRLHTVSHFRRGKNYGDSKKTSGCWGLGRGRDE